MKDKFEILKEYVGKELTDYDVEYISNSLSESDILEAVHGLLEESIDRFSEHKGNHIYIEIRPVLDAIALLVEKNVLITPWSKNNQKVIGTYNPFPIPGMEDVTLDNHLSVCNDYPLDKDICLKISDLSTGVPTKILNTVHIQIDNLIKTLKDGKRATFPIGKIIKAIRYKPLDSSSYEIKSVKIQLQELYSSNEEYQRFVSLNTERIRDLISHSIKLVEGNDSLIIKEIKAPNVFFVIRYALVPESRKKFGYTAQILLGNNQKRLIRSYLTQDIILKDIKDFISKNCIEELQESNITPDKVLELLEDSIDSDKISQSDNCFNLETVRFSSYKREAYSKNLSATDNVRDYIESKIYDLIDDNDEKGLFYIPIHLNGAPWAALYRIKPRDKRDIDYINFYRTKITHIASKVRDKAVDIFFDLLMDKYKQLFSNDNITLKDSIDLANQFAQGLSCFYPFYIPILPDPSAADSKESYLEDVLAYRIDYQYIMNEIWKNEIDYDNIPVKQFNNRFKKELKFIYSDYKAKMEYSRNIVATYSMAHLIKNKLKLTDSSFENIENNLRLYLTKNEETAMKGEKKFNEVFMDLFSEYKEFDESIRDFLTVLDCIPKSYKQTKENNDLKVFLLENKPEFRCENEVDIKKLILENAQKRDLGSRLEFNISNCIIKPFIENQMNGKSYCPSAFLYDVCILECLLNFEEHVPSDDCQLIIDMYNDDYNFGLILRNRTNESSQQGNSSFTAVGTQSGFTGAISYINNSFVKTGVGEIFYRNITIENETYFELLLRLEAIKFNTK